MTKPVFAFVCLAVGCFAGSTLPVVTAQSFAPNPKAQRWEGYCRNWNATSQAEVVEMLNGFVKEAGANSFEPVSLTAGSSVSAGIICFKRPSAQ